MSVHGRKLTDYRRGISLWAQKPPVVHMHTNGCGSGILGDSLKEDILKMSLENLASQMPSLVYLLYEPGFPPLGCA